MNLTQQVSELTLANQELRKSESENRKLYLELEQKFVKRTAQYAFISQVNQIIVHLKDAEELYQNVCRIALEYGKFKMAWVGLFDTSQRKISLSGYCGISLANIKLFTDVPYEINGPQDCVLKTGLYFLCNDIENQLHLEFWKAFAAKNNIGSFIVLPIRKSGKIIGTFNLYATKIDFFEEDDIKLLVEVTGDISFALDLFEKAKKHREAEEIIIKNDSRFRALIEQSSGMEILATAEGEIFYASPSVFKILGYTLEEILKTPTIELIHPDDISVVVENVQKIMNTHGSSFFSQHRLKHKNGKFIWCEGTFTNMLQEPNVNALVSNFRDISEKKLIEIQQEFESNNLGALINNTNDLMWSLDREFNLITSNKPFDAIIKQLSGNVVARGSNVLLAAFNEQQLLRYKEYYERAFAGEIFTEIEYTEYPVEIWSEISYYPIRSGDAIVGTACHSRDITKLKKAERELNKSEARLAESQALAKIGSWQTDLIDMNVIWSSETFRIFEVDPDDFHASHPTFLEYVHPEDRVQVNEAFLNSLETNKINFIEHRIITASGLIKVLDERWQIFRDKQSRPVLAVGTCQDITERKKAEAEREKLTNDIIQRNHDLEQFTFIISHNLRAPTANIIGFAENLKDATLSPMEFKDTLQGLSLSVSGLDAVIKDINSILQVKREINEKKEWISFSKLVNDIFISIGNLIDKHQVRIRHDFSEVEQIFSLKIFIHSIFYNLISNSIKYRQHDIQPLIEITSKIENGNIALQFKDNGMGIDMTTKGDKVFGLYNRFHSHVEGKGMGLFMVKTQVESIGGKISVKSEPNKGTEFTIVFEN